MKAYQISSLSSSYKHKSILILGGAGFIGSNLAEELVKQKANVTIVDGLVDFTGGKIENIEQILPKITFYERKIEDIRNIEELLKKQDLMINSMGLTSHNFGMENPLYDAQLNLISHIFLITHLKNCRNAKLIYLGSRGQYGNVKTSIIDESTPQTPIDVQGVNKMAAEYYYKIYSKKYSFNISTLRITNCFGENQKIEGDDIGLIGSFIKDILNGKKIKIYGDENRVKNIIYIKDLVDIILAIGAQELKDFHVFNVGGYEVTLKELLNDLMKIIGKGEYITEPFPEAIKNIDVGTARYSDSELRDKIGNLKITDREIALRNTVNYFCKRQEGGVRL